MRHTLRDVYTTLRTEGALLPPDVLQRIAEADKSLPGLTPADYHCDGEKLNEAASRAWQRLQGRWAAFEASRAELPADETGTTDTRERWLLPLFQELGYGRLIGARAIELDGKTYPVSHLWQSTPIHLVGCNVKLDARAAGVAGAARQSPHSLVQELLNRSDDHLWAFVSNGLQLRILRDNVSLSRQAYVEFDLEAMMRGELYADFVLLWLLCHESRVEADKPEECWLERWMQEAQQQGVRALDGLRSGVQRAIEVLGRGFLAHGANQELLEKLRDGRLENLAYYRQLLRLVYRLLFLSRPTIATCFFCRRSMMMMQRRSSDASRASASRGSTRPQSYASWRLGVVEGGTATSTRPSILSVAGSAAIRAVLSWRCRHWAASCSVGKRCLTSTAVVSPTATCWRPSVRWPSPPTVAPCAPSTSATSAPKSWGVSTSPCSRCSPCSTARQRPST